MRCYLRDCGHVQQGDPGAGLDLAEVILGDCMQQYLQLPKADNQTAIGQVRLQHERLGKAQGWEFIRLSQTRSGQNGTFLH